MTVFHDIRSCFLRLFSLWSLFLSRSLGLSLLSLRSLYLLPDFGNDSPYLFTPMYEASFKGTKR